MRRIFKTALVLTALMLTALLTAQAQQPTLLVLSKDGNGPITRNSLKLTLKSNPDADKTKDIIPDGSSLVSDNFNFETDSTGVGTFLGAAKIVSADGRVILQGVLRGTVGLNTQRDPAKTQGNPGHLEGLFEAISSSITRASTRSFPGISIQTAVINFSADTIAESASPVPLFRARLDGVISKPPSVLEKVIIVPDRLSYSPTDGITAIIFNGSDKVIQAYDQQSYCTIVQLQIQDGDQWKDVAPCPLDSATRPVNIYPFQKLEVHLQPNSVAPGPNKPGLYRLALTFRVVEDGNAVGDRMTVASPSFRITAPPSADKVSVATEKDEYLVGEPIAVKIANGNDVPILTADHQSNCTIVTVQMLDGEKWKNVAPCPLLTPTRLITIGAQQSYALKLPNENSATSAYPPGVYRLAFTFFFADTSSLPNDKPTTVYSPKFTIKARA